MSEEKIDPHDALLTPEVRAELEKLHSNPHLPLEIKGLIAPHIILGSPPSYLESLELVVVLLFKVMRSHHKTVVALGKAFAKAMEEEGPTNAILHTLANEAKKKWQNDK